MKRRSDPLPATGAAIAEAAALLRPGGVSVAELQAALGRSVEGRASGTDARVHRRPRPRPIRAPHELDASGFDVMPAEAPPDTLEWLAVRDRLARAARNRCKE
ncbi:MAG: hypothetical protein AB1768_15050 [Pseudomonadota bacterium]|jgi:hypothetical protein